MKLIKNLPVKLIVTGRPMRNTSLTLLKRNNIFHHSNLFMEIPNIKFLIVYQLQTKHVVRMQ
jgi:hypothetical protein